MAADTPRILDLRRRLQADPASVAFAQLGEELRRAGAAEEAVRVCRAGLQRHAGYLSARVTLGQALLELAELDAAQLELSTVLATAPDNLAAIRSLAEIHHRRGEIGSALEYYRRAVELARHEPELEQALEGVERQVTPGPGVSVEEMFDFDRLVAQLEATPPAHLAALDAIGGQAVARHSLAGPVGIGMDPFARLESELRGREGREVAHGLPDAAAPDEAAVLAELEAWLGALRATPP